MRALSPARGSIALLAALVALPLFGVAGEARAQRVTITHDPCAPEAPTPDWCRLPAGEEESALVCFYAEGERLCEVRAPRDRILLPNTPVRVIVEHEPTQEVLISMSGQRGLFTPAADSQGIDHTLMARMGALRRSRDEGVGRGGGIGGPLEEEAPEGMAASDEPPPPPPRRVTTAVFGPRLPGQADVEIRVRTGDQPNPATAAVELIVEQTYSGALRIGFGMAFGNAVDRRYGVSVVPGSAQPEVVATGGGVLDIELVIGFAPFLETFWGGRAYTGTRHLEQFPFGLSPYVGVAILGSTSDGADFLTSFYLGLEFEPARGFSIAVTTVARRVTRLLPGISVGDAADAGSTVARKGYEFGWGIVINVSPDFLQATGALVGSPAGGG